MFCTNCGKQLPIEAKFCPNCGNAASETGGSPTPQNVECASSVNTYRLMFKRSNQFYAVNPPMIVLIDGANQLSVENAGEASISLQSGQHHIVITSSIRKKKFDIYLNSDTVVLLGWNRLTGALQAEIC